MIPVKPINMETPFWDFYPGIFYINVDIVLTFFNAMLLHNNYLLSQNFALTDFVLGT